MPPATQPKPQSLTAPTGGTGHASDPALFEGEPPRLAVCLNMTSVPYPDGTTGEGPFAEHRLDAGDPKSIAQILAWIDDRIHQPLDAAWAGPAGELSEEWNSGPEEDAWARAFSEVFFGLRYGGPGECYFGGIDSAGGARWDSYIFSRFQRRSLDYFEVYKVRSKARPPATFLELGLFKKKLAQEGKELKRVMVDNDDPAVSLATACQHLSTYGALSRGFTLEEHLDGSNFAAAQNGGKSLFNPEAAKDPTRPPKFPGGFWYPTDDALLKVAVATGVEAPPAVKGAKAPPQPVDPPMGPGGIYCYNPFGDAKRALVYVPSHWVEPDEDGVLIVMKQYRDRVGHSATEARGKFTKPAKFVHEANPSVIREVTTPVTASAPMTSSPAMEGDTYVEAYLPVSGQKKGSHIFFVLRVSKDKKRAQRFDTSNGYPLDAHQEHTILEPLGKEGIYDGNGEHQIYKGHVFCGMGVLPPAPEDLAVQAAFLRRARPVGLLRLVITERRPAREMSERHVLFASRLLRMYGDEPTDNFWVSRCAWSLRNTPGFTDLQPWWIIYTPRGDLAQMMWARGGRKRKLSALAVTVGYMRRLRLEAKPSKAKGSPPTGLLFGEDFRDTIVLTNDERGDAIYWSRKRSDLSFGSTNESVQGNPLPDAIRAFVAPKPGNQAWALPWDGEHVDDRYVDPDAGSVDIEVPLLFRDGEDPNAPAEPEPIALAEDPTPEDIDFAIAEEEDGAASEAAARA